MSEPRDIRLNVRDHTAWITICRPERRNALALVTMAQLAESFTTAADSAVWAIVLTGTGSLAFCAGADLKEMHEFEKKSMQPALPVTGVQRNVLDVIIEVGKPTIAAISGAALGAGCELLLACDVRISSRSALIALPEAKPGHGANFGSVMLPCMIPCAVALDNAVKLHGYHRRACAGGWISESSK